MVFILKSRINNRKSNVGGGDGAQLMTHKVPQQKQKVLYMLDISNSIHSSAVAILELIRGAQCLIEVIRSSGEEM
jgi:uncharacterized protein with von Willebrand factor type A (vWA) domain